MAAKYTDTPLSLIATPTHVTGETDEYAMNGSQMALVHNAIIRGFNSIYQQAEHVKKADVRDFIGYSLAWIDMVHGHHDGEEAVLFPLIEEGVGIPGFMDGDKQEHAAFHGGMGDLKEYLDQCNSAKDPADAFTGSRVRTLLDAFGPALHSHLSREPQRLVSLREFPDLDMATIKAKLEKDAMDRTSVLYGLPMLLFNLDVDFEDGRWNHFPEIPAPVRWTMVNVFGWWRSNWWRFGSAGSDGKRQQLLALREDY